MLDEMCLEDVPLRNFIAKNIESITGNRKNQMYNVDLAEWLNCSTHIAKKFKEEMYQKIIDEFKKRQKNDI